MGFPKISLGKQGQGAKKYQGTPRQQRKRNIVVPYVRGLYEKSRVFSKHDIPLHFRPGTTLRQRLVHPKDKTPKEKLNNVLVQSNTARIAQISRLVR